MVALDMMAEINGLSKDLIFEMRLWRAPAIDVIKAVLIVTTILEGKDLSHLRFDLDDGRAWRYCKAQLTDVKYLVERSQEVSREPEKIPAEVRYVAWSFLQTITPERMAKVSLAARELLLWMQSVIYEEED